jgi:hypothetical protein
MMTREEILKLRPDFAELIAKMPPMPPKRKPKAKYGGMEISDAKRLRSLEEENRKLKKLLAESMLDQAALKELLTKKW